MLTEKYFLTRVINQIVIIYFHFRKYKYPYPLDAVTSSDKCIPVDVQNQ